MGIYIVIKIKSAVWNKHLSSFILTMREARAYQRTAGTNYITRFPFSVANEKSGGFQVEPKIVRF